MGDELDVNWGKVAAVAGGVVAVAVAARGVSALIGVAFNELRHHAGDPEVWMRRRR